VKSGDRDAAQKLWERYYERLVCLFLGQSGTEAAKALGMKVATVFVARSKVQAMQRPTFARVAESAGACWLGFICLSSGFNELLAVLLT